VKTTSESMDLDVDPLNKTGDSILGDGVAIRGFERQASLLFQRALNACHLEGLDFSSVSLTLTCEYKPKETK